MGVTYCSYGYTRLWWVRGQAWQVVFCSVFECGYCVFQCVQRSSERDYLESQFAMEILGLSRADPTGLAELQSVALCFKVLCS